MNTRNLASWLAASAWLAGCSALPPSAAIPSVHPAGMALTPVARADMAMTPVHTADLAAPPAACGNTLDIDTAFAVPTLDASIPTVASASISVHAHQVLADPPGGIPFNAEGEVTVSDNNGSTLHGRVLHIALAPVVGAARDTTADVTGVLDNGAFFQLEATDAAPTNGLFTFGSHLNWVSFNGAIVVATPELGLTGMIVPYSFVGMVPLSDGLLATRQQRACIAFMFGGFTSP